MFYTAGKFLVGYIGIIFLAYTFQRNLIYLPFGGRPSLPNHLTGIQNVAVVASDGVITEGWHLKGEGRGLGVTLVMFHGNGGHRGHRLGWALAVRKTLGVNILLTDPRGYAGNKGSPTEDGLYEDGVAALKWAREVIGGKMVLYGESIGGGVAVEVAKRANEDGNPVDGVILQAAFTSLTDVATGTYPFLFPQYLLIDKYDNYNKIDKIKAPLMIIHGTKDEIVPYNHGLRLYRRAKSPKMMLTVPNGDHNAVVFKAAEEYFIQVEAYLKEYIKPSIRLRVDPKTIFPGRGRSSTTTTIHRDAPGQTSQASVPAHSKGYNTNQEKSNILAATLGVDTHLACEALPSKDSPASTCPYMS
eukprot:CAMPEP_0184485318 /NCGR_PEP_ID=MMETSP0113_2-20130426/6943_1 /TAXON_ID=91329 /ORGANISM="Norrisiella sphaerica, Strain BC52" /LENGTH=357 /DNA_ID=CAMNT_0026866713 /DNA_START=135 /DNA_END=1208 /DNA_ORIENTATION=+